MRVKFDDREFLDSIRWPKSAEPLRYFVGPGEGGIVTVPRDPSPAPSLADIAASYDATDTSNVNYPRPL